MQTRKETVIEVLTGTFLGLLGSWLITIACLYAIDNKLAAATVGTALCTVWSLVRGYMVRRWFNAPKRPQSPAKVRPFSACPHTMGEAVARTLHWPTLPDK